MKETFKTTFNPRYDTLDHWRGVAALAVVIFHGFGAIRGAGLSVHPFIAPLKWLSDFGWFGVHLFFVISGYCIAANVYRLAISNRGAWDFFRDRLLRIYPTYWAACLITLAANALAAPFTHVPLIANLPASWTAGLANVFLVEPYVGVQPFMLVSWSLVYELGFYLLVASGFALWKLGIGSSLLFVLGFGCVIAGLLGVREHIFYILTFWPEFFCGGLVFVRLWQRLDGCHLRLWPAPMIAGVSICALLMLHTPEDIGHTVGAGAFAILLYVLYPLDTRIGALRGLRWLAWVGTMAYSLYLTHIIFMGKFINLGARWIASDSIFQLPLQIAGWGVAIFGAWIIFHLCERPLEEWRQAMRGRNLAPIGFYFKNFALWHRLS